MKPALPTNRLRRLHDMEALGLPTFGMPVSRFDVAEFIGDQFDGGPVATAALIELAADRGARPAVLLALRCLPRVCYRHLDELWVDLPLLPDAYDPWAAAGTE